MTRLQLRIHSFIALTLLAGSALWFAPSAFAGGPLFMNNNQPVLWKRSETRGGTLNSATVNAQGHVVYRVDTGTLGPLSEASATAFVNRIFEAYTNIPFASLEFINGGRILDPLTGQAIDVNGSNFGRFIGTNSDAFQNPIVFDSDGAIHRAIGADAFVLGFFTPLGFSPGDDFVEEGAVVLNGASLTQNVIGQTAFLGVFTHEFGHFAGPLDHAQINGNIADNGEGAILPPGFTSAAAFDLFAPFAETVFPFLFNAPFGSQFQAQFPDSGFFIATLDLDTQNALSNLYPTANYFTERGSIEGRVLIRTTSGDIPINGINVVARRISQGPFPPPLGTQAFPAGATVVDGVPLVPPAQAATDSLATISSAVTGLDFGSGAYRIQGLPSGQYLIAIQQLPSDATGGSGIGPLAVQFPLVVQEAFNGPRESGSASDTASDFEPVNVTVGQVATGIDIILNGFSDAPFVTANETEPNEVGKKSPRITVPAEITGAAASTDTSKLKVDLGGGFSDKIEDLYRFTLTASARVYIFLEATSGSGDLDLYLFRSTVHKKKTSLSDPNLIDISGSAESNELIATSLPLPPGTYLIGISAFDGSQGYRLRVLVLQ